jgi:transposase
MDEGRFGRISNLTDCWAPAPVRPKVPRQVVRQSLYAFAAVAPARGEMVHRLSAKCNTAAMSVLLLDVLQAWPDEPILLILDGAGWHKAKSLPVPERLRLWHLPAYCPECNPSEHLWDETREKGFANRLFETLDAVEVQLKTQLQELSADRKRLTNLTYFPWQEI